MGSRRASPRIYLLPTVTSEAQAAELAKALQHRRKTELIDALSAAGVPVVPLNNLAEVFFDPHVTARSRLIEMGHSLLGTVDLFCNSARFSETPVNYRLPPPQVGEHDADISWLEKIDRPAER